MTTIQTFYNEHTGSVLMLADSQITSSHLKISSSSFQKISIIGSSLLLGGSGSVADAQFLSKEILKTLQVKKIISDDSENLNVIDVREFGSELSSWLYSQNRSMYSKSFESSFLLAGFNQKEKRNEIYSCDFDGSLIDLKYGSVGSGSELCLANLQNLYTSNKKLKLNDEQVAETMASFLWEVCNLDIYTNQYYKILYVNKDGEIKSFDKLPISKLKNKNKK
jgi:20S proteasome alpha/beta subunit